MSRYTAGTSPIDPKRFHTLCDQYMVSENVVLRFYFGLPVTGRYDKIAAPKVVEDLGLQMPSHHTNPPTRSE